MTLRRLSLVVILGALLVPVLASPASAGGSHIDPVEDRYEPGDEAKLVGYIGPGQLGWVEDGPFYTYLVPGPDDSPSGIPLAPPSGTALGPLSVVETGARGYLSLRVSITFRVPSDLTPGQYQVTYCNSSCDEGLGDLIGGYLYVSVDPPAPITREWPFDEPEIANLADDALISGPGFSVPASAIRAGQIPSQSSFNFAFGETPFGGSPTPSNQAADTTVTPRTPHAPANDAIQARGSDDGATWLAPTAFAIGLAGLVLLGTWPMLRSHRRRAVVPERVLADVEPERELEPL